jgi:hypothetical protein
VKGAPLPISHSSNRGLLHRSNRTSLLEQSDEWATQSSRYMTLETIGTLSDTASVSLPAAAA